MAGSTCNEGARLEDVLGRARLARVLAEFYRRTVPDKAGQWPDAAEGVSLAVKAQKQAERDCESHRKACSACRSTYRIEKRA